MKRLFAIIALTLFVGSASVCYAMTTQANAKTAAAKARKTSTRAYAHLHLEPQWAVNPPTASSLGLKGPVKTVTYIVPIFEGQYENEEGAGLRLTFDEDGRILVYDYYNFGDAGGHTKYTFTYDALGRLASACSDCMEGTQDPYQDDQSIISDYEFAYDGNRLASFTEQTKSVWGKDVNWPKMHFSMSYDADGNLKEVKCTEQPSVFAKYSDGQKRQCSYINKQDFSPENNDHFVWEYCSPDYYWDYSCNPISPKVDDATFITDKYGNWTKCFWQYTEGDYSYEDGEFCRFTYYE